MMELTIDQVGYLLAYWIDFTFEDTYLANMTSEKLEAMMDEFEEDETAIEITRELFITALMFYFQNKDLLTPELEAELECL